MDVRNEDLWILLISTVRYSMGRQTYMTSVAPELCLKYRAALSDDQVRQIREEVMSQLSSAEARGGTLGADMDHKSWKKFVEDFKPSRTATG